MPWGKLRAFASGLGNRRSRAEFTVMLQTQRPDIVHVHNLYPLISPAVLESCRTMRVPVVMTVHNFRLLCPNGLFFSRGSVCERCAGGKEYWCVLRNCEGHLAKSVGYALRNAIARRRHYFDNNVDVFAVPTEFQRLKLTQAGLPQARLTVLPNMCTAPQIAGEDLGDYVGFLGRVTAEKGAAVLAQAARHCPDIAFKAAGSWGEATRPPFAGPDNLVFTGEVPHQDVQRFISGSRLIVFPSLCYEVFPITLVEAMLSGRAVIASRTGGIPEIVEHGVTGLLFEPGDAAGLAESIRQLWGDPDRCKHMGEAGRAKAAREYDGAVHYESLMAIYDRARASASARAS